MWDDGGGDHDDSHDGCTAHSDVGGVVDRDRLLGLPAELVCHVTRFLGLAQLACTARSCTVLRDVAMPELRRERETRDRLLLLCREACPVPLGLWGPCNAAATCRRWGLAPERPFRELARRAESRLVAAVASPPCRDGLMSCRYGDDLAAGNRFFAERDAPVRSRILPHRLPVLMPGETLWLCGLLDAPIRVPVDLGGMPSDGCSCVPTADNRMSLRVPMGAYRAERERLCVTAYLDVEVPCDPAVGAALDPHGSASAEQFLDACVRYEARVRETWAAPRGSVSLFRDCELRLASWYLTKLAWEAARRYYELAGIPLRDLKLHVRRYDHQTTGPSKCYSERVGNVLYCVCVRAGDGRGRGHRPRVRRSCWLWELHDRMR